MSVMKLAIGAAVLALVTGSQLSRLSTEQRHDLVTTLQRWSGGAASAPAPAGSALAGIGDRVPLAAPRADRAAFGPAETIDPDPGGQFRATVDIDGQDLAVMVDTGATYVALSAEDAERIGIRPLPSDYTVPVSTANGRALVARVRLASVRLGAITVRDVPALVASRRQMSGSLLGMSFLSRLSGLRVDRGRLVLEQ